MTEKNYRVILSAISEQVDKKAVEEKLISIFEKDKKAIKKFFKKPKPTLIRKHLTPEAALRYKMGLERLGLVAEIQDDTLTSTSSTPEVQPKSAPGNKAEELAFVQEEVPLVLSTGQIWVADINISTGALMLFLIKWLLASIPALLILGLLVKGGIELVEGVFSIY
ncbi:MAG: hypothetical protein SVR94_04045 [Pseudomonadota bacterium]|nr:hypothetical protein [Pseudomonadota bacterium]